MSVFDWRGASSVSFKRSASDNGKHRNRGTNPYGNTGAPIDMAAMSAYRDSGKTYKQCGYAFGVDESTAFRRLRSYKSNGFLDKKINNSDMPCYFSECGDRDREVINGR